MTNPAAPAPRQLNVGYRIASGEIRYTVVDARPGGEGTYVEDVRDPEAVAIVTVGPVTTAADAVRIAAHNAAIEAARAQLRGY